MPVSFLSNHAVSTLAGVPADPKDTLESSLALAGVRKLLLTRFHLCSEQNSLQSGPLPPFLTSPQAIRDSQAQLAF